MSESAIAVEHGVALGVSRGRPSDFLRVIANGARRLIVMADGHTSGWDSGVVALSAPVLDAVASEIAVHGGAPYRSAVVNVGSLFEVARAAFVAAAEARPEDDTEGGPAVQLTVVEVEGGQLRVTWLARMELLVLRGEALHRVTREGPSPSIECAPHVPATTELTVARGDFVTLCSRPFAGTPIDDARSRLVAAQLDRTRTPEAIVRAVLTDWREHQRAAQDDRALIGEVPLRVAALRV